MYHSLEKFHTHNRRMSVLQYPEAMNTSDLQIWNNAAFDNGESEDTTTRSSWSPVKPIFVNRSESLDSVSSIENQSPVRTPAPVKLLHQNGLIGNSQGNPTKLLLKQVHAKKAVSRNGSKEEVCDERKIDAEIKEIEMEIGRLSSRLETLWLEKAVKSLDRQGSGVKVGPAKFMEQKQSVRNADGVKKIEEPSSMSSRAKVQSRGVGLGPSDMLNLNTERSTKIHKETLYYNSNTHMVSRLRRGVSLGPEEVVVGVKLQQLGKQEITPDLPIQNRRKSCFRKLQDIDEEKVKEERRESLSDSPKLRKSTSRRQAATTVGSKKSVKKENRIISIIQPKKLFTDEEKSVPAKKSLKAGRVVASRYNHNAVHSNENSTMRKRSLPENCTDSKMCDKKHDLLVGKSRSSLLEVTESRVKKLWEIPSEIVVHRNLVDDNSPQSIAKMPDILQPLRKIRCTNDSPRDSEPAKRVAEWILRNSYFCSDEEAEPEVCQALSFAEDDEEK